MSEIGHEDKVCEVFVSSVCKRDEFGISAKKQPGLRINADTWRSVRPKMDNQH